jgi:hypothetical protein
MAGLVCRCWSVSGVILQPSFDIESFYSWLTQFCTLGYVQILRFASTFLTLSTSVTITLMESTMVSSVISELYFLIERSLQISTFENILTINMSLPRSGMWNHM